MIGDFKIEFEKDKEWLNDIVVTAQGLYESGVRDFDKYQDLYNGLQVVDRLIHSELFEGNKAEISKLAKKYMDFFTIVRLDPTVKRGAPNKNH
jgi:hypothetical protein